MIAPQQQASSNTAGWSWKAYRAQIKTSDLAPQVRWLLTAMADVAGKEGVVQGSRASLAALGRDTGCSERTLRRSIDAAEAAGWLRRLCDGPGHRLRYWLPMPGLPLDVPAPDPGQSDRGTPANLTGDPGQSDRGTPVNVAADPGQSDRPLSIPPVGIPSLVVSVRRLLATHHGLDLDDDEISTLLAHPHVAAARHTRAYLKRCSPDDVRALIAEQRQHQAEQQHAAELAERRRRPQLVGADEKPVASDETRQARLAEIRAQLSGGQTPVQLGRTATKPAPGDGHRPPSPAEPAAARTAALAGG